jgi:hypothetical protein
MYCKKCNTPLVEIPLFNNEEDDKYMPSVLFCPNEKCTRHGLLTVVYKTQIKEKDAEDKHTAVQS